MSYSCVLIGSAICGSAICNFALNGVVRREFTTDAGGYVTTAGSSNIYSEHHCYPSGGAGICGFTIPAYGQLAVVGGYMSTATPTLFCELGHVGTSSGYINAAGTADVYPMYSVQKIETNRTANVESDKYREAVILPYDVVVAVLPTEYREIPVPRTSTYYDNGDLI